MYETNGTFGKARISDSSLTEYDKKTFFCYTRIFWHSCNEQYFIKRPEGADNFLILLTLDGSAVLEIENKKYSLSENKIAIIPPNTAHIYFCSPSCTWTFYGIHIVGNFAKYVLERIISENGFCFTHSSCRQAADILEHIMIENQVRPGSYTSKTSQLVSDFIHSLFTLAPRMSGKAKSVFEKSVEYIQQNYNTDIDIDALSTRFFSSTSHFIRIFKAHAGMTPYQYIEKYRILQACNLLCQTQMNIADIAAAVGYKNTSNFIAYFKKHKGVTPREYRRNIDRYEKANNNFRPFLLRDDSIANSKYKIF